MEILFAVEDSLFATGAAVVRVTVPASKRDLCFRDFIEFNTVAVETVEKNVWKGHQRMCSPFYV